jgi:hypothetical protein
MNQSNKADDVLGTRLIALSYIEALVSDDEDFAEMVTSGVSTEELLRSMEMVSVSLLSIIARKMDISKQDVIGILRESSLKTLRGN